VALVGFPNVGKSTLISRISAAKPKIADYPFTTLEPNLGVVRTADDVNFTVADIPGLVEGAADGKGLGHRFLRHVTRARVLLVLLELEPVTGISPREQGRVLLDELGRYRPELLDRPRFVVGSKADVVGGVDAADVVGADGGNGAHDVVDVTGPLLPDLLISAVTGQGIPELLGALSRLVTEARAAVPEGDGTIVIHRPLPGGIVVDKVDDGVFTVIGKGAERAVSLNDVTTDEAAAYIQDRLKRLGVDRLLARAGAKDGDLVHIGGLSFTWYRDQPEFVGDAQSRRKRRS
jgi:GTP-binding protein